MTTYLITKAIVKPQRRMSFGVHTFKYRASEIKAKYNHKFLPRVENQVKGKQALSRFIIELLTKQN